jgi:SAM-dependent methyltransferase
LCNTHNKHSKTSNLMNCRCTDCGSVFIGNSIHNDELGTAYSTIDSAQYFAEIKYENGKKMLKAARDLERLRSHDSHIIDIGSGNGEFVKILHDRGFRELSVHEIPGADLSMVKGMAVTIYQDFDYSGLPEQHFDVTTLLDILEHVPDPQFLVTTCARALRAGGLLYIHTPVVTKLDRFMHGFQKLPYLDKIGRMWQRGRTSIFHLENYTPTSLELLLRRAGFTNINIIVRNELSWPLSKYIHVYLLEKVGLPAFVAPILVPLFFPLLATNAFNSNKAIVSAEKG